MNQTYRATGCYIYTLLEITERYEFAKTKLRAFGTLQHSKGAQHNMLETQRCRPWKRQALQKVSQTWLSYLNCYGCIQKPP